MLPGFLQPVVQSVRIPPHEKSLRTDSEARAVFCRLLNPDVGDLMKQAPGAIDVGDYTSLIAAAFDHAAIGILLSLDQVVVHFLAHGMNHLCYSSVLFSAPQSGIARRII